MIPFGKGAKKPGSWVLDHIASLLRIFQCLPSSWADAEGVRSPWAVAWASQRAWPPSCRGPWPAARGGEAEPVRERRWQGRSPARCSELSKVLSLTALGSRSPSAAPDNKDVYFSKWF